ncbi:MAG: hypothetical protein PF693_14105 [Spirochaetia bacterium]|nr:hypothetical protein [Spirochaetia bacterium]
MGISASEIRKIPRVIAIAGGLQKYEAIKESFDKEVLDELGVPGDIFPKLFVSEEKIGTVTTSAAKDAVLSVGFLLLLDRSIIMQAGLM